ncbi:hypothetical protein ABH922_005613 [Rhodococcus sp. 27YEA15]|uniref:hypothetical protein n=1 Tax=Rhodococcus sp. 27YEA15 TaxID=3156259 RepID=UPI003C7CAEAC
MSDLKNTKSAEELMNWFIEEYNKGKGYAAVIMHPEGTLEERPSATYPNGRKVDTAGLVGMENRQLALQGNRRLIPQRIAVIDPAGEAFVQYTHKGHTADGAEITFFGLSVIQFKEDKVFRWVDTVVRFKKENGSDEIVPY